MNKELAHVILIGIGVLGATGIAITWVMRGGDGAAMSGYFAVLGSLIGFEFANHAQPPQA